jgi:hypothetical protein
MDKDPTGGGKGTTRDVNGELHLRGKSIAGKNDMGDGKFVMKPKQEKELSAKEYKRLSEIADNPLTPSEQLRELVKHPDELISTGARINLEQRESLKKIEQSDVRDLKISDFLDYPAKLADYGKWDEYSLKDTQNILREYRGWGDTYFVNHQYPNELLKMAQDDAKIKEALDGITEVSITDDNISEQKPNSYEVVGQSNEHNTGYNLNVERTVSIRTQDLDISALIDVPKRTLEIERNLSVAKEREIYEKMQDLSKEWEEHAAKTQLLNRTIQYLDVEPVEHTSNEWAINQDHKKGIYSGTYYGSTNIKERSNEVYRMRYDIVKYSHGSYEGRWDVGLTKGSVNIAKNYRTFDTEQEAQKYIDGRIKKYSHLFQEVSPPIPKEYANSFTVNKKLLPGYTLESVKGETDD